MIPTLKTERLVLRPLLTSDLDDMVAVTISDPDMMRWLPGEEHVGTAEGRRAVAADYIKTFSEPWETFGFGMWAMCINDPELGEKGNYIGHCGFLAEQIEGAGPELAYAVGTAMWGRGLATEAVAACMDWIFSRPGISQVHGVTDHDNYGSKRVMEKVGMRHEKDVDLYDSFAKSGVLLPYYSVTRERYLSRRIKKRSKHNLEDLVSRMPENSQNGEVDWGGPAGKEIW